MKSLGSNNSKIIKDKNDENVPHLKITEVVLIQCNVVNNDYQQDSRVLYRFVPIKAFGQFQIIHPKILYFKNNLYIEVWFTEKNSKALEIEDKIDITLVIN